MLQPKFIDLQASSLHQPITGTPRAAAADTIMFDLKKTLTQTAAPAVSARLLEDRYGAKNYHPLPAE